MLKIKLTKQFMSFIFVVIGTNSYVLNYQIPEFLLGYTPINVQKLPQQKFALYQKPQNLNHSYKIFKNNIDKFISQLENNPRTISENVDFNALYNSFTTLRQDIYILSNNSDLSKDTTFSTILNDINIHIDRLNKLLKPLNDHGLTTQVLYESQQDLSEDWRPDEILGLTRFLRTEINSLDTKITLINTILNARNYDFLSKLNNYIYYGLLILLLVGLIYFFYKRNSSLESGNNGSDSTTEEPEELPVNQLPTSQSQKENLIISLIWLKLLWPSNFYKPNQTKQNVDEDEKVIQPQNLSDLKNFLNVYNNHYEQFTEVINVSPTVSDPRLLHKDRAGNSGNYRIIFDNIDRYYLVPKKDFRPEEYSYRILKYLFECINYESSQSRRFTLINPALVSKIDENTWQLREMGCIQFE